MIKQEIGPAAEERHVQRRGKRARMELRIMRVIVRHPALAHWNNAQA